MRSTCRSVCMGTRVVVRTTLGSHFGQAVVKITVLGVLVSPLMEREAAIEGFVPCQGGALPALRPVLSLVKEQL